MVYTTVAAAVPNRTACDADDACNVGECCANVALYAGNTTTNATTSRRFCTAGTDAVLLQSTYTAPAWFTNTVARVSTAACTPKAAPVEDTGSFGSYIKASVMMVVAVLSVAMF